jgi:hypothetical protein
MTSAERSRLERARQGMASAVTDPQAIAAVASVILERKEAAASVNPAPSATGGRNAHVQASS